MMGITKGSYGYIRAKRRQLTVIVVLMLALVLVIYFGAMAWLGTNQNWFTILAALICLPTAKMGVSLIMFLRATGCSDEAHEAIKAHASNMPNAAYDLYMTNDREEYAISHATVAGGSVIALTENARCDTNHGQTHIRRMMQGNGYHGYTVKIFSSLDNYLLRLEQLADLDPDEGSKDAEVLQLLKQISL